MRRPRVKHFSSSKSVVPGQENECRNFETHDGNCAWQCFSCFCSFPFPRFSSFIHPQPVPLSYRVASPHLKSREELHPLSPLNLQRNRAILFLDQLLYCCLSFVFFLLSCLSLCQLECSLRFGSERGETLEGMVICLMVSRFSTPHHQRDCVNKDKTQNKWGKKEMRRTWCTTPFPGHCYMKSISRVVLLL